MAGRVRDEGRQFRNGNGEMRERDNSQCVRLRHTQRERENNRRAEEHQRGWSWYSDFQLYCTYYIYIRE